MPGKIRTPNTDKAVKEIGNIIVKDAKETLVEQQHVVTGNLLRSVKFSVKDFSKNKKLNILSLNYGRKLDQRRIKRFGGKKSLWLTKTKNKHRKPMIKKLEVAMAKDIALHLKQKYNKK